MKLYRYFKKQGGDIYDNDKRNANSNECRYNGRKLSNIVSNIKASAYIDQICIGADNDDSFDAIAENSQEEGRIKIGLEINIPGKEIWPEIDLEDVLVFARKYCNGIYERIRAEVKPLS